METPPCDGQDGEEQDEDQAFRVATASKPKPAKEGHPSKTPQEGDRCRRDPLLIQPYSIRRLLPTRRKATVKSNMTERERTNRHAGPPC